MSQSYGDLLTEWLRRVKRATEGHYICARRYDRGTYYIGVPAAVFATASSAFTFSTIGSANPPVLDIFIALLSFCSGILASLQTGLRFSDRAQQHRASAARYAALRRHIEQLQCDNPAAIKPEVLDALRESINRTGQEAPAIPERIWETIDKRHDDLRNGQANLPASG